MNVNLLHEKLIRAAKQAEIPDAVPYAFEQRILARVRSEPIIDALTLWGRALWKAAVPCVGLMLVLGVATTRMPGSSPTVAQSDDLSTELETTLMASVSLDNTFDW
jgi:hypothetical protein